MFLLCNGFQRPHRKESSLCGYTPLRKPNVNVPNAKHFHQLALGCNWLGLTLGLRGLVLGCNFSFYQLVVICNAKSMHWGNKLMRCLKAKGVAFWLQNRASFTLFVKSSIVFFIIKYICISRAFVKLKVCLK